jgi:hypothetical protein
MTEIEKEFPVHSRKKVITYRETLIPMTQEEVPEIVAALLPITKLGKMDGNIVIAISNGGVRNVVVDSVEEVIQSKSLDTNGL